MKILIWGTGGLVGTVVGKYIDIDNGVGFIDNDGRTIAKILLAKLME